MVCRLISALFLKFYHRDINGMPVINFFVCLELKRKTEFFKVP